MKKVFSLLVLLTAVIGVNSLKAQQIGDGWAPVIPNFGDILKSGVYNGVNVTGSVPDISHPWQHLLVIRHPNSNNNHQFQLGTSFAENDRLFFRKIANNLIPSSPSWIELATRGSNSFIGNQYFIGNVGIGTNSPTGTLTVYKSEYPLFEVSNSLQKLQISVVNNAWDWANGSKPGDVVIRPLALQETDHNGLITFIPNDLNDGKSYIKFGDAKNGLWVGIFNNRIFRVDGLFVANEIKVKVDVWSDYVFHKSYKLPTLKSVEEFINANGHLPEVPSEKKVKEDGVNVAEINAILLKKIEELTLYVIELDKKVKSLEKQNPVIKSSIEQIDK